LSPECRRSHLPAGIFQWVPGKGEGFPEDFVPFVVSAGQHGSLQYNQQLQSVDVRLGCACQAEGWCQLRSCCKSLCAAN
jgi:hypothetical protein